MLAKDPSYAAAATRQRRRGVFVPYGDQRSFVALTYDSQRSDDNDEEEEKLPLVIDEPSRPYFVRKCAILLT